MRTGSQSNKPGAIQTLDAQPINKLVRVQSFQKDDLVLAALMIMIKEKEILEPNWEGSFIIDKVYSNKAYLQTTVEGEWIIPPTDAHFLKKKLPLKPDMHLQRIPS